MALQGLGTQASPYLIQTAEDLLSLYGATLTEHYLQTANIDLGDVQFWIQELSGVYDGDGYTISNAYNYQDPSYQGFFRFITGSSTKRAVAKNMVLDNYYVYSQGALRNYRNTHGIFVGQILAFTDINNIHLKNSGVSGTSTYTEMTGLFAGQILGQAGTGINQISNIVIEKCRGVNGNKAGNFASYASYTNFRNIFLMSNLGVSVNLSTSSYNTFTTSYAVTASSGWTTINNPIYPNLFTGYTFGADAPVNHNGTHPYLTFIGSSVRNAIPITTYADLSKIRTNMSAYFKLMNDIMVTSTISTYAIAGTFSGYLDGNGYAFKNITISAVSFFEIVTGTITKLGFEYVNRTGGTTSALVCGTLSDGGKLNQVQVIFNGTNRADTNHGFATWISNNTTIENCSMYQTNMIPWESNYVATGTIFGRLASSASGVVIKNNTAYVITPATKPLNAFDGSIGTSSTVSNNVFYCNNPSSTATSGTTKLDLADFQNPVNSAFSTFDKASIWNMQSGKTPVLKVFNKIVQKIQKETVKAYSRIATATNKRFISKLLKTVSFAKRFISNSGKMARVERSVDSFTQGIESKLSVFKGKLKSVKAFSRKYQSKLSKKKKANKRMTSHTGKVYGHSFAEALRKTLIQIASFAEKMKSSVSKTKKQSKLRKGHTKRFYSRLKMKKKVGRVKKSFSKSFQSKTIRNVSVSILVQSFVEHMKSSSFAELFRKRVAVVTSHSGIMISKLRKFSNIYNFAKKTVNSGVKAIVSNVSKTTSMKRMVESYLKPLASRSTYTYILAGAKSVMAFISHKFNQVRLFKRENETDVNVREHETKINIKDDGGEG